MRRIMILGLILGFMACSKQDIEVPEMSPLFFIEAKINGEDKLFEAGRSAYFMHTVAIDLGDRLLSRSTLGPLATTSTGKDKVGIDIYRPSGMALSEMLVHGGQTFTFDGVWPIINTIVTEVDSDFPTATFLSINNAQHDIHTNTVEYHQVQNDTLKISYLLDGEGLVSFSQILRTVTPKSYAVHVTIEHRADNLYDISIEAETDQFNVRWSDGQMSKTRVEGGARTIVGRLTTLDWEPIDIFIQIPENGNGQEGRFGFTNNRKKTNGHSDLNIDILYEDEHGQRFRSRYIEQPASSVFIIDAISPYKANSKGQMTYIIKGWFEALLIDKNGIELQMESQKYTFAIAEE